MQQKVMIFNLLNKFLNDFVKFSIWPSTLAIPVTVGTFIRNTLRYQKGFLIILLSPSSKAKVAGSSRDISIGSWKNNPVFPELDVS